MTALVSFEDARLARRRWSGRNREELEAEVDEHFEAFVRVGIALAEIQDRRLYEEVEARGFTTYVKTRWGLSYVHAFRLMQAAEVVQTLPNGNVPPPAREWQARALVPLKDDPEVLEAAWSEVVETTPEGAPITAASIRKVVKRYIAAPVPDDAGAPASEAPLAGFHRADDVLLRDLYTKSLARLAFLQNEAATLERKFRRRARTAIREETLSEFSRRLAVAVDQLDGARRMRLLPPLESPGGDADVG